MKKSILILFAAILSFTALSQTSINKNNGITGSGTANYLPRFSAAKTLSNSVIYQSSGNIGIGTNSPITKLDINGSVYSNGGRHGDVVIGTYPFVAGASNEIQANPLIFNYTNGFNAGFGTNAVTSKLHIKGSNGYNQLRLELKYSPSNTSDPNGLDGDFAWDDSYLYIRTSSGWKRTALTTF